MKRLSFFPAPPPAAPDTRHIEQQQARQPDFAQLMRCDWGTHVTVLGHPGRFNQAGMVRGRQTVVVVAGCGHADLRAASPAHQYVGDGENAYYLDYEQAGLRIGTPAGAPLMRDQAIACLRAGDVVLLNGTPVTLLALKRRNFHLWLALLPDPAQAPQMLRAGALPVVLPTPQLPRGAWRLRWGPATQLRLVSARLPGFDEVQKMRRGTPVTLGPQGTPALLQGSFLEEGTRQFVTVRPLDRPPSQTSSGLGVQRLRFQEAGLRVVDKA